MLLFSGKLWCYGWTYDRYAWSSVLSLACVYRRYISRIQTYDPCLLRWKCTYPISTCKIIFFLFVNLFNLKLSFENIRVQSVEVLIAGLKTNNEFSTFWQQSDVDLSRGLDFSPRGAIFARFTHLQHAPFSYKIIVSIPN